MQFQIILMGKDKINTVQATDADYEKAEMDQLRDALKRTYLERFFVMTKLMKRGKMLKNAKMIYQTKNVSKGGSI
jgi:hypothetical protein